MKVTFKDLCSQINDYVAQDSVSCFKIGKSIETEVRENDKEYDGYNLSDIVIGNNPADISTLESKLIDFFKSNKKCKNEITGSAGNTNANTVYVAVSYNQSSKPTHSELPNRAIAPLGLKFPINYDDIDFSTTKQQKK